MKITYYSKYSSIGPSSRYRAFQYADLWRSSGFDFRILELFDDRYFEILRSRPPLRFLRKIPYTFERFRIRKQQLQNDKADLRIIEQQLFPYASFRSEKKYLPSSYLLEFDDGLYLTHPDKMPRMIAAAEAIIAGNETLAEYARQFHPRVHVVPTVLNTAVFKPAPKKERGKVIVGWCGLEYNFPYLKLLTPVLKRAAENSNVEIRILSGSPPRNFDFPFQFMRWNPLQEVEQLNEFDIGLMPLRVDAWTRGKCGFKLLQYMSLAIPSIATPVGVNEKIVRNGINGYLAKDLSEWESRLNHLISDPALREKVGREARSTVLAEYSTDVWFPRLVELYSGYARKQ